MKSRVIFLFLSALLSLNSTQVLADRLTEIFNISTELNKSELYPYSLELSAAPESLLLFFDGETGKFKDATSTISVSTNIPSTEGEMFEYDLSLVSNDSACYRISDDTEVLTDVMNLELDGVAFTVGNPVTEQLLDIGDDGNFSAENTLVLKSQVIDLVDQVLLKCSGSISLEAELSL